MASSSADGNYSLALDYPLPEDPHSPTQKHSDTLSQEPLLSHEIPCPSDSVILYQNYYSSKNTSDSFLDASQSPEFNRNKEYLEVNMYSIKFQPKLFFKSLFISLFYISGFFTPILCFLRACAPKFFRNFHYYGDGFALTYLGICSFAYMLELIWWVTIRQNTVATTSYLTHFQILVVHSLVSAAVGAFCNKKLVDILNNTKLQPQSLTQTRFEVDVLSRAFLNRKRGKKELLNERNYALQQTISRLDIDISLYYMTFFDKTPEKLLRKIINKKEDFALTLEEKENKIFYNQPVSRQDLPKAITNFERLIFNYKYFTKPNKFDNEKAHAYPLALDLITNIKRTSAAWILIQIFYSAIIIIYIYSDFVGLQKQQELLIPLINIVFTLFYYIFPYITLGFNTLQAFKMMSSKLSYMQELKELMSSKNHRLENNNDEPKAYPNMNIFDFRSLKTWACLRKIFMRLDDEKLKGKILAVTIIMTTELITLIVMTLFYLKIFGASTKFDYSGHLVFYALKSILYLSAFFVLVYYAAKVNRQFKMHRSIVRENKQIVTLLFTQYSDFIGENAIEPGTYIYNEGLKFLKKEFGEDLTPEVKANMKEYLQTLTKTYDSVLEELDSEEAQNPIRILGLPITSTVVKSFGTVLVSLSAPIFKSGISLFIQGK